MGEDLHGFGGEMGGFNAPGLGVEVVGAGTDVLDRPEGDTTIGDGDDATRRVGREHEGLAAKIFKSVGVGEVYCVFEE